MNDMIVCFVGKRYSLPNSRIMIHQPLGGAQGGQTDLDIQVAVLLFYFGSIIHSICFVLWL